MLYFLQSIIYIHKTVYLYSIFRSWRRTYKKSAKVQNSFILHIFVSAQIEMIPQNYQKLEHGIT